MGNRIDSPDELTVCRGAVLQRADGWMILNHGEQAKLLDGFPGMLHDVQLQHPGLATSQVLIPFQVADVHLQGIVDDIGLDNGRSRRDVGGGLGVRVHLLVDGWLLGLGCVKPICKDFGGVAHGQGVVGSGFL